MHDRSPEVTRLLRAARDGDATAFDRLLPLVYAELKSIADRQLRRERAGHTLGTTGLVHEAYLKLVDQSGVEWENRAHFYAVASRAMRQVLIDYARRRAAQKRGGDRERQTLEELPAADSIEPEELLALDAALDRLGQMDERLRKVVEYRFFGGMKEDEIADTLGVTPRTVQRDWVKARAWLHKELYPPEG
ncbi:MAG: sigma-70 family RNA polymerase sigma factor [Gemmatimonadetes bacterium]|uniref:Sigma-70 family RNA polymerase sigma factor n=1 Tax=Candidatus Kutchimonas denitrificans TaxID=3056748 RepID=A0AAE4ZDH4_9BACT|nr:sigma-70 family RNA polymerase sigma factor [Gemmatimonadota bacterium]NIR76375.1 sigma-70 family RNA polymerase sigma factor [Candidatus Kutchimonas denitrificans]NIS03185.1 sigma-70 family RNA polymerase sigma factor [Gemmatimonadota bacterium]NIT66358.1 sigma-70 family RNA polymerase sigma factor [Gemmatimonadota bacterium]NIU54437.1 sigma-70 family RNA polymerase sigma factor [Gemmatimonadota bacterium]